MPYCIDCGTKLKEDDTFCYKCGAKVGEEKVEKIKEEPKVVERVIEKEVQPKKSSGLKIFFLLLIIGVIVFFVIMAAEEGLFEELLSGGEKAIGRVVDPCEREFNSCNHECGEGILSSICKEKCSYSYRKCKGG